ncbi:hypothetical protein [Paraburkholderia caffeinilytica]|uniref:hypothetical protein n=1 Tax=Paraburkholderia caffeinilytica TaxID=1761016 RepID=UPI003D9FC999
MMASLVHTFGAKGVADFWLLMLNGLLATTIFAVLLLAHPRGHVVATFRARLARFALVCAYGVLALRVWAGWYNTPVEPTHVVVNLIVLWIVWTARGDVSEIVASLKNLRTDHSSDPPTA